jgi:hypothetical protein
MEIGWMKEIWKRRDRMKKERSGEQKGKVFSPYRLEM